MDVRVGRAPHEFHCAVAIVAATPAGAAIQAGTPILLTDILDLVATTPPWNAPVKSIWHLPKEVLDAIGNFYSYYKKK